MRTRSHYGLRRSTPMTMAKAISMKADKAQNLLVLTASALMSVIVLNVVSLLIVGVVRPMLLEW